LEKNQGEGRKAAGWGLGRDERGGGGRGGTRPRGKGGSTRGSGQHGEKTKTLPGTTQNPPLSFCGLMREGPSRPGGIEESSRKITGPQGGLAKAGFQQTRRAPPGHLRWQFWLTEFRGSRALGRQTEMVRNALELFPFIPLPPSAPRVSTSWLNFSVWVNRAALAQNPEKGGAHPSMSPGPVRHQKVSSTRTGDGPPGPGGTGEGGKGKKTGQTTRSFTFKSGTRWLRFTRGGMALKGTLHKIPVSTSRAGDGNIRGRLRGRSRKEKKHNKNKHRGIVNTARKGKHMQVLETQLAGRKYSFLGARTRHHNK